ncbi:MAG: bacteriophage abortive infection AbiH family protein [Fusobacterium sp.]
MNLFIIGNGFDIAHGLKTRYTDFAEYLKINDINLYNKICVIYKDLSDEDRLWKNFEKTMEFIDEDFIRMDTDFNLEYMDEYDDELKSMVEIQIQNNLIETAESLFNYFRSWASSIQTKGIKELTSKIKGFDEDEDNEDLFLTFNYNFLLEESYNVDNSQICHIHNSIDDELILGHGNKLKLEEFENESDYLNKKRYDENGEENYETIEELEERLSCEENLKYYEITYKDTESIIASHKEFFKGLTKIKNIYVIGHSLGDVDLPYFKEILRNISSETKWFIYYFSDNEKRLFQDIAEKLNIKLENLTILHSSTFFDLIS